MPRQTGKSALAGKLGGQLANAHKAHAADETKLSGGGDLPAGIENGIAQLVDCKFDKYKKGDMEGEYYFYAAGTVVIPKSLMVDGAKLPVEGLRTTIMEPVCDTPQRSRPDVDAHIGWILNEFRKLGVDTKKISPDDYEKVAAALKKSKPYFRFRTWQGQPSEEFPNPHINHDWRGKCDFDPDQVDAAAEAAVVDNTSAAVDSAPPATAAAAGDDLDALATTADSGDEDAQVKLTELALEAGVKQNFIDNAESWTQVAEEAQKGGDGTPATVGGATNWAAIGEFGDEGDEVAQKTLTEEAESRGLDPNEYATWVDLAEVLADEANAESADPPSHDPDTPITPVKGHVYFFKPPRARNAIEGECTAVFEGRETCNMKEVDTGKSHKAIPWDRLQHSA